MEKEDVLVGRKVTFPEDNKIVYYQDFQLKQGLPSDVEFTVVNSSGTGSHWIEAKGYGILGSSEDYGNGKISIKDNELLKILLK